jgi:hypothetical protein
MMEEVVAGIMSVTITMTVIALVLGCLAMVGGLIVCAISRLWDWVSR